VQQQNSSKDDQYEIVWPNGLGNTISSEIEAFLKSEDYVLGIYLSEDSKAAARFPDFWSRVLRNRCAG